MQRKKPRLRQPRRSRKKKLLKLRQKLLKPQPPLLPLLPLQKPQLLPLLLQRRQVLLEKFKGLLLVEKFCPRKKSVQMYSICSRSTTKHVGHSLYFPNSTAFTNAQLFVLISGSPLFSRRSLVVPIHNGFSRINIEKIFLNQNQTKSPNHFLVLISL